jgi:hypothetical protein
MAIRMALAIRCSLAIAFLRHPSIPRANCACYPNKIAACKASGIKTVVISNQSRCLRVLRREEVTPSNRVGCANYYIRQAYLRGRLDAG